MLYLTPILLLVIAYMYGELVFIIIGDKDSSIAEKCIVGTFLLLITFEIFFAIAMYNSIPFHILCKTYSIFLLLMMILILFALRGRLFKSLLVNNPVNIKPCILVLAMLLIQIACFFVLMPDTNLDQTLETINATIASDAIYSVHPGIGESFNGGMYVRGIFVSLPIFYSYIYSLFDGNTACFVYRAIPSWTLFLSFISYGIWAKFLFNKEEKIEEKISIFLTGLGLLNLSGMFSKDCVFYSQMFRGFRGETISFTVILPYCVYCIIYMINTKTNRKMIYLFLALLAELSIADYEKCFIPTVACVLLCIIIYHINKAWRWFKCRQ